MMSALWWFRDGWACPSPSVPRVQAAYTPAWLGRLGGRAGHGGEHPAFGCPTWPSALARPHGVERRRRPKWRRMPSRLSAQRARRADGRRGDAASIAGEPGESVIGCSCPPLDLVGLATRSRGVAMHPTRRDEGGPAGAVQASENRSCAMCRVVSAIVYVCASRTLGRTSLDGLGAMSFASLLSGAPFLAAPLRRISTQTSMSRQRVPSWTDVRRWASTGTTVGRGPGRMSIAILSKSSVFEPARAQKRSPKLDFSFGRGDDERLDDLFAGTPGLTMIKSVAPGRDLSVMLRAPRHHVRLPGRRCEAQRVIELPRQDAQSEAGVHWGRLKKAMYGTREATQRWS